VKRARGTGGPYLRGSIWWLKFSVGGRTVRLSTGLQGGTKDKPPKAVVAAWAEKLGQLGRGYLAGGQDPGALRYEYLERTLVARYQADNRKGMLYLCKYRLPHLRKAFGGFRLSEMPEEAILEYAVRRRDKDGVSVDTVNLELALLRRGFNLLRRCFPNPPVIHRLPGSKARQETITDEALKSILAKLPPHYRAPAMFLRLTGWRSSEARCLEWRRVDWKGLVVRLDTSKSGRPRFLVFARYRKLHALLRLQRMRTRRLNTQWVFPTPEGKQLTDGQFRQAWTRVRNKLGYRSRRHDLRRTRVQEQERQGMPMTIGMSAVGIETPQIYRRYGVVSETDQAAWLGRSAERP
jgi:integrase